MFSEFNYFDVNSNNAYYVEFSQLNTELLLDGFESNCAQYDIKNEHGNILMQSDCVEHCLNGIEKDNLKSNFSLSWNLITTEILSSFGNKSIKLNLHEHEPREEREKIA